MRPDDELRILVIYKRPAELPSCYVVRGHRVLADGQIALEPGAVAFAVAPGDSDDAAIKAARRHCAALGKVQLDRHPSDDPVILETWI